MDLHTQILLEQYDELLPVLEQLCGVIKKQLEMILQANDIEVTTVKARVKKRDSLEGKLRLKGSKYLNTKGLYEDNVRIEERVGQGFVELVESGRLCGPEAEKTVLEVFGLIE